MDHENFKYRRPLQEREIIQLRKEYWARKAKDERETFERMKIPPGFQ